MISQIGKALDEFLRLLKNDTKTAFIVFLIAVLFCGGWIHKRSMDIGDIKQRECDEAKQAILNYLLRRCDALDSTQKEIMFKQKTLKGE